MLLLIALGLAAAGTGAAAAGDAQTFINDLVAQALKALDNKQLTTEDRTKQFRELLDHDFDMARISRFMLRRYWNEANEQERKQFETLFEEYVRPRLCPALQRL